MEHLIDRMEKEYTAELQVGGRLGRGAACGMEERYGGAKCLGACPAAAATVPLTRRAAPPRAPAAAAPRQVGGADGRRRGHRAARHLHPLHRGGVPAGQVPAGGLRAWAGLGFWPLCCRLGWVPPAAPRGLQGCVPPAALPAGLGAPRPCRPRRCTSPEGCPLRLRAPAQVPGINHYENVIEAVYCYWRAKHERAGRPLIQRLWYEPPWDRRKAAQRLASNAADGEGGGSEGGPFYAQDSPAALAGIRKRRMDPEEVKARFQEMRCGRMSGGRAPGQGCGALVSPAVQLL